MIHIAPPIIGLLIVLTFGQACAKDEVPSDSSLQGLDDIVRMERNESTGYWEVTCRSGAQVYALSERDLLDGAICRDSPVAPFKQWCESAKVGYKPPATQALMRLAKVESCEDAGEILASQLTLDLRGQGIVGVEPIASLTQLEYLDLSKNPLLFTSKLHTLKSLRHLILSHTDITSLTFTSQMLGLRTLWIDGNRITSLQPLVPLINLHTLVISGNPIMKSEETCPTLSANRALTEVCRKLRATP